MDARIGVLVAFGVAACGGGDTPGTSADADPTAPDAAQPTMPDAGGPDPDFTPADLNNGDGPLCDIPPDYIASGGDPTYIDCDVAHDRFSDVDPSVDPGTLRVVAWNIEFGNDHAAVVAELMTDPDLAGADVILLSEVARASLTSNPDDLDVARELATTLAMDYLFAVEWDRREKPDELGEHGVAILSKYPLGNVTQIRHVPLNDWWNEEQLYGGRITLAADALVGGRRIRFYSSHLCTRGDGGAGRAMQAAEIRADAELAGRPAVQVVGGDLNTWTCNPSIADCTVPPDAEQTVQDFLAAGWLDGTAGWDGVTQLGAGFFPQRLDWLFYRGAPATPGEAADTNGSDHLPVFFELGPLPWSSERRATDPEGPCDPEASAASRLEARRAE